MVWGGWDPWGRRQQLQDLRDFFGVRQVRRADLDFEELGWLWGVVPLQMNTQRIQGTNSWTCLQVNTCGDQSVRAPEKGCFSLLGGLPRMNSFGCPNHTKTTSKMKHHFYTS